MNEGLRPDSFGQVVGQKKIVELMSIMVGSFKKTKKPAGHILLTGPSGTGKTTLAEVFAKELGKAVRYVPATILDKPDKVKASLQEIEPGEVIFIDEIHRLSPKIQEFLYSIMEDGKYEIFLGTGDNAVSLTIDVPPIHIIGATTHPGDLNAPLLRRFQYQLSTVTYTLSDLSEIGKKYASRKHDFELDADAALRIAKLARKNPSITNSLIDKFCMIRSVDEGKTNDQIIDEVVRLTNIDPWIGLDLPMRKYLTVLMGRGKDGHIGINTLSTLILEQMDTIRWIIEPYLTSMVEFEGETAPLAETGKSGRQITDQGIYYLECCEMAQRNLGLFEGEIFPEMM